jgi:hypothetical protein
MVFEKVEVGARGQGPSQHEHTPLFVLRLDFDENNGTSNGKKRMKVQGEGHHLNRVGLKVK